uniref:Uncharacterized protein n=1 Tax=Romanomermis culicivorax TaxID=13658 RepID=A0A915KWV0_ROMCU
MCRVIEKPESCRLQLRLTAPKETTKGVKVAALYTKLLQLDRTARKKQNKYKKKKQKPANCSTPRNILIVSETKELKTYILAAKWYDFMCEKAANCEVPLLTYSESKCYASDDALETRRNF